MSVRRLPPPDTPTTTSTMRRRPAVGHDVHRVGTSTNATIHSSIHGLWNTLLRTCRYPSPEAEWPRHAATLIQNGGARGTPHRVTAWRRFRYRLMDGVAPTRESGRPPGAKSTSHARIRRRASGLPIHPQRAPCRRPHPTHGTNDALAIANACASPIGHRTGHRRDLHGYRVMDDASDRQALGILDRPTFAVTLLRPRDGRRIRPAGAGP